MTPRTIRISFLLCCVICLGLVVAPASTWAVAHCKVFFKQKQFVRAARCFQTAAEAIEKKQTLTNNDRLRLSQYFRNTALALRMAARKTKSAAKQSYLREQALKHIRHILKKKYYASTAQKNLAVLIRDRLEEKIGLVQLTVTTGSKEAKVKLSGGYRFPTLIRTGITVQIKLRPGTYTILVTYPQQQPQARVITIKTGQAPLILQFKTKELPRKVAKKPIQRNVAKKPIQRNITRTPPPPRSRPNVVPWVVAGIGGVATVAGVILIVAGVANNASNNTDASAKALQGAEQFSAADLRTGHNNANLMYSIGWGVGGVGLATTITGIVLYAVQPKTTSPSK